MILCALFTRGMIYIGATVSLSIFIFTLTLCMYAWAALRDAKKNQGA